MSDIERELQNLPWRRAPDDLRDRLFLSRNVARAKPSSPPQQSGRRVSVVTAFGLANAAAIIGFLAGTLLPMAKSQQAVASRGTDIRVVETTSTQNSFDFSAGAIQILPGEFTAYVDDDTEHIR